MVTARYTSGPATWAYVNKGFRWVLVSWLSPLCASAILQLRGCPQLVDQAPQAAAIRIHPTDPDPEKREKKDPVERGDGDARLIPHPTGSFRLVECLKSQTTQMAISRFWAGSDTLLWENIDNTTQRPIHRHTTLFPASLHPQTA